MTVTWLLIAHGSAGKILAVRPNGEIIATIREFLHPRTAKKELDNDFDAKSHSLDIDEAVHHAIDYDGEIEDYERRIFAKEITSFLMKPLGHQEFDKLIVVASRELLGDLRKEFPTTLKNKVTHELNKDLISNPMSDDQLINKIRNDLDLVSF